MTTEKLLKVMNNFEYSLEPLALGVNWTETDHSGPIAYQIWGWDAGKAQFVGSDWVWVDTPGLEYKILGPKL